MYGNGDVAEGEVLAITEICPKVPLSGHFPNWRYFFLPGSLTNGCKRDSQVCNVPFVIRQSAEEMVVPLANRKRFIGAGCKRSGTFSCAQTL